MTTGRYSGRASFNDQTTLMLREGMHLELGEAGSVESLSAGLGTLAEHLGGLGATDTSTPLTALLVVLVGAK